MLHHFEVKFVFTGTARIRAGTVEEAEEKLWSQFGMTGGTVTSTMDDEIVIYDICLTPDKEITYTGST